MYSSDVSSILFFNQSKPSTNMDLRSTQRKRREIPSLSSLNSLNPISIVNQPTSQVGSTIKEIKPLDSNAQQNNIAEVGSSVLQIKSVNKDKNKDAFIKQKMVILSKMKDTASKVIKWKSFQNMICPSNDQKFINFLLKQKGECSFVVNRKSSDLVDIVVNVQGEIKHVEWRRVSKNGAYQIQTPEDELENDGWSADQVDQIKNLSFNLENIILYYNKGGDSDTPGHLITKTEYVKFATKQFNENLQASSNIPGAINFNLPLCEILTEQDSQNFLLDEKNGSFLFRAGSQNDEIILSQNVNGTILHTPLITTDKDIGLYKINENDLKRVGFSIEVESFPLSVFKEFYISGGLDSLKGKFISNDDYKKYRNDLLSAKIKQSIQRQDFEYNEFIIDDDSKKLDNEEVGSFLFKKTDTNEIVIIQKLPKTILQFPLLHMGEEDKLPLYKIGVDINELKNKGFTDKQVQALLKPRPLTFYIELFKQGGFDLEAGFFISKSATQYKS